MSFGLNLQFLREQAGMTQEGLAEALQVSRQSVSKWESDTCFPEMEKLLTLCGIFRVDLDTLLRKDVRESFCTDTAGYDRFMNRFSNAAALGIGLMLFSVAGGLALYGFAGLSERWLAAALISGAAVATAILMVAGMRFDRFEREHPVIPDFYSKEERERFLHRYPILVAAPVTAFFLAVLWLLLLGGEAGALLGQRGGGQTGFRLPAGDRCRGDGAGVGGTAQGQVRHRPLEPEARPQPRGSSPTEAGGPGVRCHHAGRHGGVSGAGVRGHGGGGASRRGLGLAVGLRRLPRGGGAVRHGRPPDPRSGERRTLNQGVPRVTRHPFSRGNRPSGAAGEKIR